MYKLPFFSIIPRTKWSLACIKLLAGVAVVIFLVHPGRFAKPYEHIPDEDIVHYLTLSKVPERNACSILPDNTSLIENINREEYDEDELAKQLNVYLGGSWSPVSCQAVHETALVIPYRDRKSQLMIFVRYMHQFLQSQSISYRIVVVEQAAGKPFNRGKLMNVGYREALKLHPYPCFVFHDVDLIPQVRKNIYGCSRFPRHMSASINVWRYNLLYHGAFGGAVAILNHQFRKANGFSNEYFGWGAEDDDFLMRIRKIGLNIVRFSPEVSRYFMLPHKTEAKNPERFSILESGELRAGEDGLRSLQYQVLAYRTLPLYTHVLVQI